jgi:hypothetical protein
MELFTITEFDELLDSGELDPRPRIKKAVREILRFEMQHVPAAIAAEMTRSRLKVLGKALVEIIEDRDARKWVDVVFGLRGELRRVIARERESGRLQPWSAEKEIKDRLSELAVKGWSGRIVEHLRTMLRKGEATAIRRVFRDCDQPTASGTRSHSECRPDHH